MNIVTPIYFNWFLKINLNLQIFLINDDTITLIIMELKLFYISGTFISIFSQNLIKNIIEVILAKL